MALVPVCPTMRGVASDSVPALRSLLGHRDAAALHHRDRTRIGGRSLLEDPLQALEHGVVLLGL